MNTDDRVTAEELAEVARLDAAATPGPWSRCSANNGNCQCGLVWGCDVMLASVPQDDADYGGPVAPEPDRLANWQLLAITRALLPRLAREVAALRADLSTVAKAGAMIAVGAERDRAQLDVARANLEALRAKAGAVCDRARLTREDERDDVERAVPTSLVSALRAEADKPSGDKLTAERDAWKSLAKARSKRELAVLQGDHLAESLASGECTQAIRDLGALGVDLEET